ncbi:MAG: hypothetical protein WC196_04810 [Bacilli bacterium]
MMKYKMFLVLVAIFSFLALALAYINTTEINRHKNAILQLEKVDCEQSVINEALVYDSPNLIVQVGDS